MIIETRLNGEEAVINSASYADTASFSLNSGPSLSASYAQTASLALTASSLMNIHDVNIRSGFDTRITASGAAQLVSLGDYVTIKGDGGIFLDVGIDGDSVYILNPNVLRMGNVIAIDSNATASHAKYSDSSSYALTASVALNAGPTNTASYALTISQSQVGPITITDPTNVATLNLVGDPGTGGNTATIQSIPSGMSISVGGGGFVGFSNDIHIGNFDIVPLDGKFLGTASFANTASFALNGGGGGGVSVSQSIYATQSLYATSSISASYVASASAAMFALSASWANSASYALSASFVVSSSYTTTASFALVSSAAYSTSYAKSSSWANTLSNDGGFVTYYIDQNGEIATTGDIVLIGNHTNPTTFTNTPAGLIINTDVTAPNFIGTASMALSAIAANTAISASWAPSTGGGTTDILNVQVFS